MPSGWTDEDYRRMGMTPPGKGRALPAKPVQQVAPTPMAEEIEDRIRRKAISDKLRGATMGVRG